MGKKARTPSHIMSGPWTREMTEAEGGSLFQVHIKGAPLATDGFTILTPTHGRSTALYTLIGACNEVLRRAGYAEVVKVSAAGEVIKRFGQGWCAPLADQPEYLDPKPMERPAPAKGRIEPAGGTEASVLDALRSIPGGKVRT